MPMLFDPGLANPKPGDQDYRSYLTNLEKVSPTTYTWADGTPLSYDGWHSGQPNSSSDTTIGILFIPNLGLNDKKIDFACSFICEVHQDK